jgi:hypothetical protein
LQRRDSLRLGSTETDCSEEEYDKLCRWDRMKEIISASDDAGEFVSLLLGTEDVR